MAIEITNTGITVFDQPADRERLRREFDRNHCLRLPQLLAPALLNLIQERLDKAKFYPEIYRWTDGDFASELRMQTNTTLGLLHFLINDEQLLRLIQEITGNRVGCFEGRVYCMKPGHRHYLSWHDDLGDRRRICAMSINLSPAGCRGGVLQIRDCESKRILHEVANTGFGDAVIFRVADHLEHRVTDVVGNVPRLAFAGWFRSKPDYRSFLRKTFSKTQGRRRGHPLPRGVKHVASRTGRPGAGRSVTMNDRVEIKKQVVYRAVDDEMVLIDVKTDSFSVLDPIGSRVWELLANHGRVRDVFDIMRQEYDVDPKVLQRDIVRLVQELEAAGLVGVLT